MGVYSPDMLAHFPEQFRMFTYFDMIAGINSGYTVNVNHVPSDLWGILQNDTSYVTEGNGNLVEINHENLWTENKLVRGLFVQFDDTIYRIVNGSDWPTEGGFYHYTLERLVGDNGTVITQTWESGANQL